MLKALPRREQQDILARIARDRRLRRVLGDISDGVAIEEERGKPSRPLRDYIADRERRERGGFKAARGVPVNRPGFQARESSAGHRALHRRWSQMACRLSLPMHDLAGGLRIPQSSAY